MTDTVKLWDLLSGKAEDIAMGGGKVYSVAFAPGGDTLAAGYFDGAIRLWDVAAQRPLAVMTRHEKAVGDLAFSPDGNLLASGGVDGYIGLWRLDNLRVPGPELAERILQEHSLAADGIALKPDPARTLGRFIFRGGQPEVRP